MTLMNLLWWCTRIDTATTLWWEDEIDRTRAGLARWRWPIAVGVILFSVADLAITQTILTMVHGMNAAPSEANPIMAPIVMSWWAWPVRVGIPLLATIRDLRRGNHQLMAYAFLLYAAVVGWNLHVLNILGGTL